jgi:hypothetical protein
MIEKSISSEGDKNSRMKFGKDEDNDKIRVID